MPFISINTPCYNEEDNIEALYAEVKRIMGKMEGYTYEHLFIDNFSTDHTVEKLRYIAERDKNVKVIVNMRNFGQVRSPYHAFLQARGEAVITLVADFQDPPAMIPDLLMKWEAGYKVVLGVKKNSLETPSMFALRTLYYRTLQRLSDVELIENFTGFGLYDRQVIEDLRLVNDPYPYFRGLIAELGYPRAELEYVQPARKRGITKNNFYTLYDVAMLGVTNHSKVPLRLAAMLGFISSAFCILVAFFYLIYKLLFWSSFSLGLAPLVVGIFFFSSVQLFFLGIVGEYIGAIYTHVRKMPYVIERERINFE